MQHHLQLFRFYIPITLVVLACTSLLQAKRNAPPKEFFFQEQTIPDTHAQELDKQSFSVKYPKNWAINTQSPSYNPNRNITFTCPQNSYLQLYVFKKPQKDPQEKLNNILHSLATAIVVYSKQNSNRWGRFPGTGIRLEGKMGGEYPGGIHIFVSDEVENRSFIITEFYYSEDLELYQPGVDIVKATLHIKPFRGPEKSSSNQDTKNDKDRTNSDNARSQSSEDLRQTSD